MENNIASGRSVLRYTSCITNVRMFHPASNQKSVSERPMRVCLGSRARAEVKVSIK